MRLFNRKTDLYPPNSQYIGRGTYYGNPFVVGVHGKRGECIERFRCEILPDLDVEGLRGYNLVCNCAPNPCHGEAILDKLYGDAWRLI